MTPLKDLPTVEPRAAAWLQTVGIATSEDLESVGPVEAYRRVRERFPEGPKVDLLWALEAALEGAPPNELAPSVKRALLEALLATDLGDPPR